MRIGNRLFSDRNRTYIMGILNVTPDSFSDGGRFYTEKEGQEGCFRQAEALFKAGADIIDVGGESTRPGFKEVDAEEELERILPVLDYIRKALDIPVSVDTRKPFVAEGAVRAGAALINDVSGLMFKDEMAELAAREEVCYCLSHNRERVV